MAKTKLIRSLEKLIKSLPSPRLMVKSLNSYDKKKAKLFQEILNSQYSKDEWNRARMEIESYSTLFKR